MRSFTIAETRPQLPSVKPDWLYFSRIITTKYVCLQKELFKKLGPKREVIGFGGVMPVI